MSSSRHFELPFAPSLRSTVGIEWELALVDDDSGELRQAAPAVIAALDQQGRHPHIHAEFMQNTVELVSGVSHTVAQAGADVEANAVRLRKVTDPMRIGLIGAGTHPYSAWQSQKITSHERYLAVLDRAQMVAQQAAIFGVHTHVGIETRDKVVPLLNSMLTFQPHLIALAASSPFWGGQDTGFASMRSVIFQQLPTAGIPYQFNNWQQLEGYVHDLLKTGTVKNFDEVRWDIRPSCRYGTLEIRVCDDVSNLKELLAITALTHCLVEYLSTLIDEGKALPQLTDWYVAENKWRAARYGLDTDIIIDGDGTQVPLRQHIADLVELLQPTAQKLGCVAELNTVNDILHLGAGYDRQRRVHGQAMAAGASHREALEAVVDHLVAEMRADEPLLPYYN